jgi:DNA-binding transcriptional LysR family regulator
VELRNLRALVEVVRRTTFSRAAKELFAKQSAVSKTVKQLEDELGMLLLERNGRNLSPFRERYLNLILSRVTRVADLSTPVVGLLETIGSWGPSPSRI